MNRKEKVIKSERTDREIIFYRRKILESHKHKSLWSTTNMIISYGKWMIGQEWQEKILFPTHIEDREEHVKSDGLGDIETTF